MGQCVFWYPRTVHSEIKRISKFTHSEIVQISDIEEKNYYVVFLLIEREDLNEHGALREDIDIYVVNEKCVDELRYSFKSGISGPEDLTPLLNGTIEKVIALKQKQASRNGLVLYEYEDSSFPSIQNEASLIAFWSAIYHNAKGFYHVHEFHHPETDSILLAYLNGCDIQGEDNNAIHHYIGEYVKKFEYTLESLNDMQKYVQGNKFMEFILTPLLRYQDKLINVSYNIEGELLYCKSLLESRYYKCKRPESALNSSIKLKGYINNNSSFIIHDILCG